MYERLKPVLEVIGLVISAVGQVLLFYQEKYVAACLVLLIFAVLIWLVIRDIYSTPIAYISIHYHYDIVDASGRKVKVLKVKKFVPKEKNLDVLVDERITVSGRLAFPQSNIGKVVDVIDQGGTYTVYTLLTAPLEKGKEVEHILEYVGIDSLLNPRESVTSDVVNRCPSVGLHVQFPQDRLPIRVSAYNIYKGRVSNITEQHLDKKDREYSVVVENPKLGTRIILEWEW